MSFAVLRSSRADADRKSGKDIIVTHKFTVGQAVDLAPNRLRAAAAGRYEIRHLVPASDSNPENPCYRIKSIAEKHDRVVPESELTLSTRPESVLA
jgi:hypothetical protein